jgi:hypothetical protein
MDVPHDPRTTLGCVASLLPRLAEARAAKFGPALSRSAMRFSFPKSIDRASNVLAAAISARRECSRCSSRLMIVFMSSHRHQCCGERSAMYKTELRFRLRVLGGDPHRHNEVVQPASAPPAEPTHLPVAEAGAERNWCPEAKVFCFEPHR